MPKTRKSRGGTFNSPGDVLVNTCTNEQIELDEYNNDDGAWIGHVRGTNANDSRNTMIARDKDECWTKMMGGRRKSYRKKRGVSRKKRGGSRKKRTRRYRSKI